MSRKIRTLVEEGTISQEDVNTLAEAVKSNKNIAITGCLDTGKTSLLGVIIEELENPTAKLVVLEDIPELNLSKTLPDRDIVTINTGSNTYVEDFKALVKRTDTSKVIVSEIKSKDSLGVLIYTLVVGHPVMFTMVSDENINASLVNLGDDLTPHSKDALSKLDVLVVHCTYTQSEGHKVRVVK